jgi:acyl-CoA dehydrogenase
MYSFEPTEEQRMLMSTVGQYSTNVLRPAGHEAEESGKLQKNILDKGWDLGILQGSIPELYGGYGDHSLVTGVLAIEEMAYGDLAATFAIGLPGLFALPILLCGSEEQKRYYLPKIVNYKWRPFTSALIEKTFDFDPMELKTTAHKSKDEFILNGDKGFVPYAMEAEAFLVYARFDNQTQGFILPRDVEGLSISADRERLMSINSLPLHHMTFHDVKIPLANRLGGTDGHNFDLILSSMRVAQSAAAIGVAKAAFEYSRDYAKEREAFGVKIGQKQAIAFMLAEMCTEIEATRLLTWEAAWKIDHDKEGGNTEAYLASVNAMDMVMMVTDRAVQILGGHGYIRDHPVEMWMRNGRGFGMFTGFIMV